MDGEIDIERAQQIADSIQFLVERHDPTADEQRAVEKTDLAQGAKQSTDRRRKVDCAQDVHLLELSPSARQLEEFLQIGDAFPICLNFFPALVTLLKLPLQVRQLGFRDMPINDPALLAGDEIMVGVLFALVPLLSDVKRPFRIARDLLRKGSQNIAAAPVFLFEQAANGVVFFRYFHIIK